MRVLVAGCGWLGSEIARRLVSGGHRVIAVRRDPARALPAGVEPLFLDLSSPGAAGRLPAVDRVVACQAAGSDGPEAYRAAYVEASRAVLEAAGRTGARVVYTGSTGVFGQRDGSDVDEETPPAPASGSAQVLVEAEALVRGQGGVVVRLSGLYGPGRAGVLERVRSGRLALGPGDGAWMNFCHLADAAAAVLAALERGAPGAVYHASDAEPPRRREVVTWIAGQLGIPPPQGTAPAPPGPDRRILAGRSRQALGLTLAFPSFRDGLAPLLPPRG
ncbi:MAG: NAD-dependent epimerase/dehydratase family protein [Anaeromyxobacter sp.]